MVDVIMISGALNSYKQLDDRDLNSGYICEIRDIGNPDRQKLW